jgi:hypothetical protein
MPPLEDELAVLATMSSAQLRAEWKRVMRTEPPAFSPDLLQRALAYERQERRHGGLSSALRREIERLGRQMERNGSARPSGGATLFPGTRLSRDWHGRSHHVLVLEDGFLFEERRYRSLSHIANAITGTRWSGPRFFGLVTRLCVVRSFGTSGGVDQWSVGLIWGVDV